MKLTTQQQLRRLTAGNPTHIKWTTTVHNIDIETGEVLPKEIIQHDYYLEKTDKQIIRSHHSAHGSILITKHWRKNNQLHLF